MTMIQTLDELHEATYQRVKKERRLFEDTSNCKLHKKMVL